MSLYAIPPLIGTIFFFCLGLIVLFNKPRTLPKTIFAFLCLETINWQFVWFLTFIYNDPKYSEVLVRLAYVTITFIPTSFYHFVIAYTGQKREQKYVKWSYALSVALVLLIPGNLYVSNQVFDWGHFSYPGPLYPVFLLSALLTMFRGLVNLRRYSESAHDPKERNKAKYLLIGFILYFFCTLDFLQVYGAP